MFHNSNYNIVPFFYTLKINLKFYMFLLTHDIYYILLYIFLLIFTLFYYM